MLCITTLSHHPQHHTQLRTAQNHQMLVQLHNYMEGGPGDEVKLQLRPLSSTKFCAQNGVTRILVFPLAIIAPSTVWKNMTSHKCVLIGWGISIHVTESAGESKARDEASFWKVSLPNHLRYQEVLLPLKGDETRLLALNSQIIG